MIPDSSTFDKHTRVVDSGALQYSIQYWRRGRGYIVNCDGAAEIWVYRYWLWGGGDEVTSWLVTAQQTGERTANENIFVRGNAHRYNPPPFSVE